MLSGSTLEKERGKSILSRRDSIYKCLEAKIVWFVGKSER